MFFYINFFPNNGTESTPTKIDSIDVALCDSGST